MVRVHLRGPSGHLLARGWSSRDGEDEGARVLPMPLLPDRGGVVGGSLYRSTLKEAPTPPSSSP